MLDFALHWLNFPLKTTRTIIWKFYMIFEHFISEVGLKIVKKNGRQCMHRCTLRVLHDF